MFLAFPEYSPQAAPLRELFFTARTERIKAVRTGLRASSEHRSRLEQALSYITELSRIFPKHFPNATNASVDEFLAALKQINERVAAALTEIDKLGIVDTVLIGELSGLLTAGADGRRAKGEIQKAAALPQLLHKNHYVPEDGKVNILLKKVNFLEERHTDSEVKLRPSGPPVGK